MRAQTAEILYEVQEQTIATLEQALAERDERIARLEAGLQKILSDTMEGFTADTCRALLAETTESDELMLLADMPFEEAEAATLRVKLEVRE